MHEDRFVVTVTGDEIVNNRPEGTVERVSISKLKLVMIETNDSGPWGADVWWMLIGSDLTSGCVFPQGATGESDVLAVVQKLPGFDNQVLVAAMTSTENKRFVCWQADA